jgi:hypothetical protein
LGFAVSLRRFRHEDELLSALDFFEPDLAWSGVGYLLGSGGRPRAVHESLARSSRAFVGAPPEAFAYLGPRRARVPSLSLPAGRPGLHAFSVAMIGNGPGRLLLPAELPIGPEELDSALAGRLLGEEGLGSALCEIAAGFLARAGARDYARCDLLSDCGRILAIDTVLQPPLPDPWFAECTRNAGMSEEGGLASILFAALLRLRGEGRTLFSPPPELCSRLSPQTAGFLAGRRPSKAGFLNPAAFMDTLDIWNSETSAALTRTRSASAS